LSQNASIALPVILETILAAVEECRVGWIYCEPEQAPMCLSVASKIYWDVEVIITHGEVEGCTNVNHFFQDDGTGLINYTSLSILTVKCTVYSSRECSDYVSKSIQL
jgi:hypothetical protein